MTRLLFASSEAMPLIKTGGLADVSGSLPTALKALGEDVRLILPAYPEAVERLGKTRVAARFSIDKKPHPSTARHPSQQRRTGLAGRFAKTL
jgi:starch synthase